ncbi:Aromatic/aminoadipate aminotransferase 1 [Podospora aff. communis PSN243]|uniref:aromatic-amino-acid transaminase n=1 Tax=Podospora aff. communis PSN243 TaxID=3040156 RepID=A0AAV9GUE2_9PEZI|nr:Aromatic/aminoadipate aminotransferase 1 [Podospora aff. communis PSN243]
MRRALSPTFPGRAGLALRNPHPHPVRLGAGFHTKGADRSEAIGPAAKTTKVPVGTLVEEETSARVKREGVTVEELKERRRKAGRLVAGTAAYSDTDMFKGPSAGKPKAKRWDHHLAPESAIRVPCMLKQAARHLKKPGIISLGGGLPCAEYFPIDSISFRAPSAPNFSEAATHSSGMDLHIGKYTSTGPNPTSEYDLATSLNYGQANGSAQMNRFVAEHTELVSNPPYADWRSCLTVGSTAALEQSLRMLCDRSRHDAILTEEYSFSTAVETAMPLGIPVFGVPMDAEGLLPSALDSILTNWDPHQRKGARKPHVLYTVPSGQNPTGATQGEQRRRDIYAVACKHDVFILEDEPYYFLQMPPYPSPPNQSPSPQQSTETFLSSLIPTLLSLDVQGRVLRMDSFSKVVVPGSRLGWVTASEQIIERYIRHAEVCNQGPSGISQVVLHKLLDETWGHDGYIKWLMHLRGEYTKRRDVMMRACEGFLPRGVVSWTPPRAGMFHWLKVDHTLHPSHPNRSILDIEEEIFNRCIDGGVLIARGSWFRAEHDKPPSGLYFRATFAAATEENMTEAIRRLGVAIRETYGM